MNKSIVTGNSIEEKLKKVKKAWPKLLETSHEARNKAILKIGEVLKSKESIVLEANGKDLEVAKQDQIGSALTDRLTLTSARLNGMIEGLQKIADLSDPLAKTNEWQHAKGMTIKKIRTPFGAILVIYESRPNVTTDTVGLALKTGNVAVLKGSRQTRFTNTVLSEIILDVLKDFKLDECFAFFNNINHEQGQELVSSPSLDLIIPRGGEGLKKFVQANAKAPILGAGGGVCHVYIAESADLTKATEIIVNAKTQRPGTCNSIETVLIHESLVSKANIATLFEPLWKLGVECRADQKIKELDSRFTLATELDWQEEYLNLTLAVKSVSSTNQAIEHINEYSTGHSDCVLTNNSSEAELFCKLVDSGCVYVNASTRFTDGEEFGFGAEIGISTQKIHARGPIGPEQLTTYKYLILGDGQVR